MRALMLLAALVAVPFAASVAQDRDDSQRSKQCSKFAAHRDNDGRRTGQDADKDEGRSDGDREHRKQCPPADPPSSGGTGGSTGGSSGGSTSSCGPTVSGGNAVISGQVTNSSFAGVPGVCVQISVNGALVAGAVTDALGNYSASVAASGQTFVVCLAGSAAATQSWPASNIGFPQCTPTQAGYGFVLTAGGQGLMASFTI